MSTLEKFVTKTKKSLSLRESCGKIVLVCSVLQDKVLMDEKQTKGEKSDLETKARGDGSRSVITTSSESGQRTCHTWTRAHVDTSCAANVGSGAFHARSSSLVSVNMCAQ